MPKEEIINPLPRGTILKGATYDYEIVKPLGQGSFGITYLANVKLRAELGTISSAVSVAIKEFFMHEINGREDATVTSSNKKGLFDDYKKKFVREAKNLSKLKHRNIIKVLEAFEANNTIYYSMEFLSGGSLDEYIAQKGTLTEDETLLFTRQIATALHFMHQRNMLHLDLKPSNIMLRDDEAVLIDFGLSKQFSNDGVPETSTTIGRGTPGYAPVEQANYEEEKEKHKALPCTMDIYALGATMFKMLTGRRPPVASDILNDGFPTHELTERRVSDGTIRLIEQAMAPLRKDRIPTAEALCSKLPQQQPVGNPKIEIQVIEAPKEPIKKPIKKPTITPEAIYQKGKEFYDQQNYTEAVKLFRQAAEQGNAEAQYKLGMCYFMAFGVENDIYEAVKWYKKAAEQGHSQAQVELSICYENGDGVEENLTEAVKWCRKAAEQGNIDGQYNLGLYYSSGNGVKQSYTEAVKWYKKAAEQGNAEAQYNLGMCYYKGEGVEADYTEAVKLFRQAAMQGNAEAQYQLGWCYYKGEGVEANSTEAVKWWEKAAEQGNAGALNNLGVCYYEGDGVEQNYTEAVKWWEKAAEQGNAGALNNLGVCYYKGKGVEQNHTEAVKWWKKAAEQENAGAKFRIDEIEHIKQQQQQQNNNAANVKPKEPAAPTKDTSEPGCLSIIIDIISIILTPMGFFIIIFVIAILDEPYNIYITFVVSILSLIGTIKNRKAYSKGTIIVLSLIYAFFTFAAIVGFFECVH